MASSEKGSRVSSFAETTKRKAHEEIDHAHFFPYSGSLDADLDLGAAAPGVRGLDKGLFFFTTTAARTLTLPTAQQVVNYCQNNTAATSPSSNKRVLNFDIVNNGTHEVTVALDTGGSFLNSATQFIVPGTSAVSCKLIITSVGDSDHSDATYLVFPTSASSVTASGGGKLIQPRILDAVFETVTDGALSVATYGSTIDTSSGATTNTLADGVLLGQLKRVVVDPGATTNAAVITLTTAAGGASENVITLTPPANNIGASATCMWVGTGWRVIECVEGAIA